MRVDPFGRQARSQPVPDARLVVIDFAEPQRLEPARGPWTEVSSRVRAVHDDRPMGIEALARLGFDPSQREVDRSRQMVLAVLPRRQHVDNLRALGHEATNLFPIDLSYQRGLLIPWDRRGSEPRRVLSDQLTVPAEDPSALETEDRLGSLHFMWRLVR